MSLSSYVFGKYRSSVGHLVVTSSDALPAVQAHHPLLLIYQTQNEIQLLFQKRRPSNIENRGHHSYRLSTKAKDTKQDHNDGSILCPTVTHGPWLPPVARQPVASLEKQPQQIPKIQPQTPQVVSTIASQGQAPLTDDGKQPGCVQRWNHLNRFRRKHRDFKDHRRKYLRMRGSWSQDWQEPLELLKRYYSTKEEEKVVAQVIAGHPRASWSSWSNSRKPLRQIGVDRIPEPLDWSVVTFAKYVEDLETSRVDRLVQRQIYGKGKSHVTAVATMFESLFQDESMKGLLNARACNVALVFFYRHGMIVKARALYTRMENLHMQIEPETFNIILCGSAAEKDLYNYTYNLRHMIKRKLSLTSRTWSSLLMAVDSSEARATIVNEMRARKLLDRFSTMRDVVDLTIRDEVASHLDRSNEMSTFFQGMDSRYAPGWLTVSGANIVLDEVGMRQSALEAFELLKEIRKRVPRLGNVALNTLLTHCRQLRAHDLAIDVIEYFETKQGTSLGQKEYGSLFRQAWRSRLYNFCRVIWRSACMDAAVTFAMQRLVMESLTFENPECSNSQPRNRADIWKNAAGKVIVGVGIATKEDKPDEVQHPGSNAPTTVQDLGDNTETLSAHLEQLMDDTNAPRPRLETLRSAKALVDNDFVAYKKYRKERTLIPLLREALAMDQEWTKLNWRERSTPFKCRNAIAVKERTTGPAHPMLVRRLTYTPNS